MPSTLCAWLSAQPRGPGQVFSLAWVLVFFICPVEEAVNLKCDFKFNCLCLCEYHLKADMPAFSWYNEILREWPCAISWNTPYKYCFSVNVKLFKKGHDCVNSESAIMCWEFLHSKHVHRLIESSQQSWAVILITEMTAAQREGERRCTAQMTRGGMGVKS